MNNKHSVRVSVDLDKDIHKALKMIAIIQEKDMSQIVKELIEDLIVRGGNSGIR